MNLSLTPKLEEFIRDKVDTGMYNNASEVVREALRMMNEHEKMKLAWMRQMIERGERQIERGDYTAYQANDIEQMFKDAGW
ncbi:type II toxin-antitoxin system ParD family antitoxin [Magnetovibrio sp. PR-2]|uniref:type II toxin-antitoxin system ParD family antitoxin n=1 Tax=Magnetovibrio sp. PR-2 TaxID=3120356 RepID=UPI002FCE16D4